MKALLEGGADPDYGNPSALQCVEMFKQDETWKAKLPQLISTEVETKRGLLVATGTAKGNTHQTPRAESMSKPECIRCSGLAHAEDVCEHKLL